MGLYLMLIFT